MDHAADKELHKCKCRQAANQRSRVKYFKGEKEFFEELLEG
jgi:hypothetical protein